MIGIFASFSIGIFPLSLIQNDKVKELRLSIPVMSFSLGCENISDYYLKF